MEGVRSLAPIADYPAFVREQQSRGWALALAPLVDTPFASYKTNNKFREFGACGIAGIYSDTPVYRESIQHGKTGWILPNDPGVWADQILQALEDPSATEEIGRRARDTVQHAHDIHNVQRAWIEALTAAFSETRWQEFSRRCRSVRTRWWERTAVSGQLTLTEHGRVGRWAPGERAGYFRRPVLFELLQGGSVLSSWRAPCAGHVGFAMLVATYGRALSGTLEVEIGRDSGMERRTLDLRTIADGDPVSLFTDVQAAGDITVRVQNHGSGPVALYACTRRSSTTYKSTGRTYPLGIVA